MAPRANARRAASSRRSFRLAVCFAVRCLAAIAGVSLDGVLILVGALVERLGYRKANDLAALRVEADDSVVVDLDPAAVDLGVDDLLAFLDLVAEDDLLGGAEELQHSEQLSRWVGVALDGVLDARAEHLAQVLARHPSWRDVVDVRLIAELGIERYGDLLHADEEVQRVLSILRPGAVLYRYQPLHSDLADAGGD